jgi:cell division topological specificity factor
MSFFQKVGLGRPSSADSAKQRLQLLLVHDRAGLSPGKLEALKDDIIRVLARHVDIDTEAVDISITQDRDQQRLVADIPLIPPDRRRR